MIYMIYIYIYCKFPILTFPIVLCRCNCCSHPLEPNHVKSCINANTPPRLGGVGPAKPTGTASQALSIKIISI